MNRMLARQADPDRRRDVLDSSVRNRLQPVPGLGMIGWSNQSRVRPQRAGGMFENLSDPVLGKLTGYPERENWTGRVGVRDGEKVKLLISYSGGEDVDLSVAELLAFARDQLADIRAGIAQILLRAATLLAERDSLAAWGQLG